MAELARLPRIKVCGITDPADALAAVDAGADAVGLVAYPGSPRAVTLERAARIAAGLRPETVVVVVMVDATPSEARRWLAALGANAVQLCGGEDPRAWEDFPGAILRRVAVAEGAREELERWSRIARGFVLDHPASPGGSGKPVDAALATELVPLARPCLLAGGLDEENVAERVARLRPDGVDASSRLELEPGRKDRVRVARFVASARAALAALSEVAQ